MGCADRPQGAELRGPQRLQRARHTVELHGQRPETCGAHRLQGLAECRRHGAKAHRTQALHAKAMHHRPAAPKRTGIIPSTGWLNCATESPNFAGRSGSIGPSGTVNTAVIGPNMAGRIGSNGQITPGGGAVITTSVGPNFAGRNDAKLATRSTPSWAVNVPNFAGRRGSIG